MDTTESKAKEVFIVLTFGSLQSLIKVPVEKHTSTQQGKMTDDTKEKQWKFSVGALVNKVKENTLWGRCVQKLENGRNILIGNDQKKDRIMNVNENNTIDC